ncbi:MAG: phage/plasmid primase, P4 family [Sedimentisphaerales bacterium]|jgi:putative DNA primase/helicase
MNSTGKLHDILSRLKDVKQAGENKWQAKCPAHDDNRPSLSISIGSDNRILLHCFAGCTYDAICNAMGIEPRDLFSNTEKPAKAERKIVAMYGYPGENGALLYQSVRYEPKNFKLRRPNGRGGWEWNLNGTRRVLYRLPELLKTNSQDLIFVCEGEKDVDSIMSIGLTATTNPGGAGKWPGLCKKYPDFEKPLHGKRIAIMGHNDHAGRKHVREVAVSLYGKAAEIRIVEVPDGYKDITEWMEDHENLEPEALRAQIMDWYSKAPVYNQAIQTKAKLYEPTRSAFHLTDAGNAELFAAMHRDILRFCSEHDRWYYWDGCRWNGELGREKAGQLAVVTARTIAKDAENVPDRTEREKIFSWSLSSENNFRLKAMLALAQNQNAIVCHARVFDKDPYLLNCLNGTIDLRTGELTEHKAGDMLTKLCPVVFDRDAQLGLWNKFLDDVTGGNAELKDFLQRAVGYALTGDTREEKLFFVHGPTAAGKSTFLEAIKTTLGDYAITADFETFLKRMTTGAARNDVARLAGAHLVVSIEIDEGAELAEGLVKILTGGDTVAARFLYQESFEFYPKFKLWLAANHAPRASDRDEALWRRILRIPFEHTIPEDNRDPAIKATLRDPKIAGPAILAWAVKGCLLWQQRGLDVPESIRDATQQYRDEQDPLRDFFEDECIFGPTAYVTVADLRKQYETWAGANGQKYTLGPREFNKRLTDKSCVQKIQEVANDVGTLKPTRCWCGVTLRIDPKHNDKEKVLCSSNEDKTPF